MKKFNLSYTKTKSQFMASMEWNGKAAIEVDQNMNLAFVCLSLSSIHTCILYTYISSPFTHTHKYIHINSSLDLRNVSY